MKGKKAFKKEEVIFYHKYRRIKDTFFKQEMMEDKDLVKMYFRIDKCQRKNAKVIALGIFFLFLSLSSIFLVEEFLPNMEFFTSIFFFLFLLLGIFLFNYAYKHQSKEGKINYQYKNMKYFYFASIFFGTGLFFYFYGISLARNLFIALGIFLFGVCFAFDFYYVKTGGKKSVQIGRLGEALVTFFICIIFGSLGIYLGYQNSKEIPFTKKALAVYGSDEIPSFVLKINGQDNSNSTWYTLFKKENQNRYKLSVSKEPDFMHVVYDDKKDTPFQIFQLSGNNDYATWSEVEDKKIRYFYYDRLENTTYKIASINYDTFHPQSYSLGLYQDKVYYEIIDYNRARLSIMEYDITKHEQKEIYRIKNIRSEDLPFQTINIEKNNLILSTYIDGVPTLLHFNLNETITKEYQPQKIHLQKQFSKIYSVSYEKDKYAIYYKEYELSRIGLFTKSGKEQTQIKLSKNHFVSNEKITLDKNQLYFINLKDSTEDPYKRYQLKIYDLKTKKTKQINGIYDYYLENNQLYGLGYYKSHSNYTRLYELKK